MKMLGANKPPPQVLLKCDIRPPDGSDPGQSSSPGDFPQIISPCELYRRNDKEPDSTVGPGAVPVVRAGQAPSDAATSSWSWDHKYGERQKNKGDQQKLVPLNTDLTWEINNSIRI